MPAGASPKREREYNELKHKFEKSGRYKGREEEVAARIVNKQRAQYGETKAEKKKDGQGKSPDRDLPVRDYQEKTIGEIARRLGDLSKKELRQLRNYEQKHKNRKGMVERLDRALASR